MECNFENCGYYTDGECNICGMGISGEDTFCRLCKGNPNCYYKQNLELKAENDKLKKELGNNKATYEVALSTYNIECGNLLEENKQLWQTLQEIKAIATECTTCGDCCECKYWEDCDTDIEEQALGVCRMILDLITKAEEE